MRYVCGKTCCILLILSWLLPLSSWHLFKDRNASAAIVEYLTLRDLTLKANLIVYGTCKETISVLDKKEKRIFTYISIVPDRCFEGEECPSLIKIKQLGGVVGNLVMRIPGTPNFSPNEKVILFLSEAGRGYYQVLGMSQGKFSVIGLANGTNPYVKRDLTYLTFLEKDGQSSQLHELSELEQDMALATLIERIESYLGTRR